MTSGAEAMQDVHSRLDRAIALHEEMNERFRAFARPGGGEERPYGIELREKAKPAGLVIASFIVERPLPVEMGLLAADTIHNTRVALDHILARLRDHFGGDSRRGSFPTWQSETDWRAKVADAGAKSALRGLDDRAVDFIYAEQPLHHEPPDADMLVILNRLDNVDKHRLLQPSFVYLGVEEGKDLIEVLDPSKVRKTQNRWQSGQQLAHGTQLAHFFITGSPKQVLRAHSTAPIGFASGEVGRPVTGYLRMVERVRAIAEGAATLIDS